MRLEVLGDAVVMTLGHRLTMRDVEQIELRLRLILPIRSLIVEFAGARDVDDNAVAYLADAARRLATSVELRGIGLHHQRLLRYLGHSAPDAPVIARRSVA